MGELSLKTNVKSPLNCSTEFLTINLSWPIISIMCYYLSLVHVRTWLPSVLLSVYHVRNKLSIWKHLHCGPSTLHNSEMQRIGLKTGNKRKNSTPQQLTRSTALTSVAVRSLKKCRGMGTNQCRMTYNFRTPNRDCQFFWNEAETLRTFSVKKHASPFKANS